MALDAEASSESVGASPSLSSGRRRAASLRCSATAGNEYCATRHAKADGGRRRQAKLARGGAAPAVEGAAQHPSRRGSRASSAACAPEDAAVCVTASAVSRVSSPSLETCRHKKAGPLGHKGPQEALRAFQGNADDHLSALSSAGQSTTGGAPASMRVSHRNWQSNCMLLYKHIMSHILEWPTLSVQWLHSCNPTSLRPETRARIYHANDTLIASKANDGCVYLFDSCKFGPEICSPDAEAKEVQGVHSGLRMSETAELVLTGHSAQGTWLGSGEMARERSLWQWETMDNLACKEHKSLIPRDVGKPRAATLSIICVSTVFLGMLPQGLCIWDFRDLRRPAHRLLHLQNEAITSLKWHPQNKAVLAAGTTDRLVRIFDCSLIGAEQSPEEAEEGPPEVVFVHGGHVAGITELDWNPLDEEFPWVIASASEDNVLQIWQPVCRRSLAGSSSSRMFDRPGWGAVKAFEAEEASYLHEDGSMDEEVLD
ncbi:hypothetical protein Emag_000358 [Eimeria magna]